MYDDDCRSSFVAGETVPAREVVAILASPPSTTARAAAHATALPCRWNVMSRVLARASCDLQCMACTAHDAGARGCAVLPADARAACGTPAALQQPCPS